MNYNYILSYRNFNKPLDKEISAFGRNSDSPYPSGKRLDQIGRFRYDPALWKKGCAKQDSARGVSRVPIWKKSTNNNLVGINKKGGINSQTAWRPMIYVVISTP